MDNQIYTYKEQTDHFTLRKRGKVIAVFSEIENTEHFVKWVVDLMNKNHAEYVKEHSEKLIREMGF